MSVGEWLNTVIQPEDDLDESWGFEEFEPPAEERWVASRRYDERERGRFHESEGRRREREPERPRRPAPRYDYREPDIARERGRSGEPHWNRRAHEPDDQYRLNFSDDERRRGRHRRSERRAQDRFEEDRPPAPRHEGRPYRDANDHPRHDRPTHSAAVPQPEREQEPPPRPRPEPEVRAEAAAEPREEIRDTFVDRAVAEITARQRALEGDAAAEIRARQRALAGEPEERSFSEKEPQPLPTAPAPSHKTETAAAQSAAASRPVLPSQPSVAEQPAVAAPPAAAAPAAVDLSGFAQQLRQITTKIEALRPSQDLEAAIDGLRTDLTQIGRSLTEALPRRALESLEIEVKALAERIDHTREAGADTLALAGLERGLEEVRVALHKLTPAESLVGFEDAVQALAKKVDVIVAKDDPAALQQLEAAIGALRGIINHVASNDTLAKVAEEVRALAAKVDGLASSGPTLSGLNSRIDTLANALKASTEAGHAVPRELEKLLSGLIEKLEWVQLTHTDHTALAHLEDRIATLVKRLDSSDARFGLLEGIERGLSDLLVHIEDLRDVKSATPAAARPVAVDAIEQEVARTQDSLEAVQGTVEHVVDRLAMIESDMRGEKTGVVSAIPEPALPDTPISIPTPPPVPLAPLDVDAADDFEAEVTAPLATEPAKFEKPELIQRPDKLEADMAARRPLATRAPIDPNLPPDHPLEPGFTIGRSRSVPSAADRIAASEAAIASKPPVIPDPGGGKSDFIAAARRAAQAAAMAASHQKSGRGAPAESGALPKTMRERMRTFIVAAAVFVIVVGGFHIVSRLFQDGGSNSSQQPAQHAVTPPVVAPKIQTEPQSAPADKPSVPATNASPEASPPTAPLSLLPPGSGGDAPAHDPSTAPPRTVPAPSTGTGAGGQSMLDNTGWPSVTADLSSDKPGSRSIAGPLAPWATPEITGSVPRVMPAPRQPLALTPPGANDKLPTAIGSAALRAAALAGDPAAAYEVAVRFAEGRLVAPNNEEAARWFERAARKGLVPAQFRLGSLYEKGLGVKKDLVAARDLYRAAAEKGHGKAMHNLAVLYAEGVDGTADYRSAVQWFRKAADRGITDSQYNLAVLYARGVGVERNLAESYKWFFLAAQAGDNDAAQKRDEVATRLDAQTLAAAQHAAEQWTAVPQPPDVVSVKSQETWDAPAKGASAVRARGATAKAPASDAAKLD